MDKIVCKIFLKKRKEKRNTDLLYFRKYHFNFNKFGIIGKLVTLLFTKINKMYLLLYWVTFVQLNKTLIQHQCRHEQMSMNYYLELYNALWTSTSRPFKFNTFWAMAKWDFIWNVLFLWWGVPRLWFKKEHMGIGNQCFLKVLIWWHHFKRILCCAKMFYWKNSLVSHQEIGCYHVFGVIMVIMATYQWLVSTS